MLISRRMQSLKHRISTAGIFSAFRILYHVRRLACQIGGACIFLQFTYALDAAEVTYADLSPILESRCVMCHSGPAALKGLHLDSLEGLLKGSQNGAVVKTGNPSASELVMRLKGVSLPQMPMTGPPFLSDEEIALFEQWIENGLLPGPEVNTAELAVAKPIEDAPETDRLTNYSDVAAIFATRCAKCHTDDGLMGPAPEGYRLTSYAATVSATDRLRVVPGNPLASELVRRIRGYARPRMPFDGPPYLTEVEIISIEKWVADGARDSAGNPAPVPNDARVRVHGQLDERWRLNGLQLITSGSTRMDKNPGPGDYVRVRGRVREDGKIVAKRITRR